MTKLHPTAELVTVAWLKTLAGVPSSAVATTLPKDATTWSGGGFVQVTAVGGTPNMYVPMNDPVVSVDCWAANVQGSSSPWGKANQLAESVRAACYDLAAFPVLVTGMPGNYNDARVHSAWLMNEPRRITDDPGSYARYTFDLQSAWTEVPS